MAESSGTLEVTVQDEQTGERLADATVLMSKIGERTGTGISNKEGNVSFSIATPTEATSQTPRSRERPYTLVDLRIILKGYITVSVIGEQIFPNQKTQQLILLSKLDTSPGQMERVIIIPEHHLYRDPQEPVPTRQAVQTAVTEVQRQVVIPETIRVHLGAPGADARNVTVPFLDYIKNVASSEIYPTWPDNSLISNIIAQVSLVLNRLYTEWYPSQGYDFDITNSTAYDQYYVHERGIFEKISTVADAYFTNYIARGRQLEPLFAQYCDGANTTCDGMSQWGTVSLARKDYTPLRILQYYYGNDIQIREGQVAENPPESFPGTLEQGNISPEVLTLQNRLNRIAIAFPSIPFILPASGTFGATTALAVRAFQRLFRLNETGTVNRETWYRIQYIYTAVKKLAELGSEGEYPQSDTFGGRVLQVGSRGNEVLRMQQYLAFISDELGQDTLSRPEVNGIFDSETQDAVRQFQNYYGLVQTGTVNEATWNAIVTSYYALGGGEATSDARPYPGTLLRRGSSGTDVAWVQTMLNAVAAVDLSLPTLAVDGVFGPQTEQNVRTFQSQYGLAVDGIVGPLTWEALTREYERVQNN